MSFWLNCIFALAKKLDEKQLLGYLVYTNFRKLHFSIKAFCILFLSIIFCNKTLIFPLN